MRCEYNIIGRDEIKMSYQDVVDYKQEAVKVIFEKELIDVFKEKGYNSVLSALKSGPLTVKELTEKSNQVVEKLLDPEYEKKLDKLIFHEPSEKNLLLLLKKISLTDKEIQKIKDKKVDLEKSKGKEEMIKRMEELLKFQEYVVKIKEKVKTKKELDNDEKIQFKKKAKIFLIEKNKRSDKTIYRYLKDLTGFGLVAQAGQRVVFGKTATETLFCRTAKIFLLRLEDVKWGDCEESSGMLDKLSQIFALTYNTKPIPVDCLGKLLGRIDDVTGDKFLNMAEEHNNELSELIRDSSFKQFEKIMNVMNSLTLIMNADSFKEELDECMKG